MSVFNLRQGRAFKALVAAQFFGSLSDNALLIVAIALLAEQHAASWATPALRLFFYLSYVLVAAFAGAVADAFPKGRVIWLTNLAKLGGCCLLLAQVDPLIAYGLVGLGAAAYSPAKYGILPELVPASGLVAANSWMEVSNVAAILLGVALGGLLINPAVHIIDLGGTPARNGTLLLGGLYIVAALCAAVCAAAIAHKPASNPAALQKPWLLLAGFRRSVAELWRDHDAQVSLAVTSLFWAVSAVLQFVVLKWAEQALHLPLEQAALLPAATAVGMVAGAVGAARWVPLQRALKVLPLGLVLGVMLLLMLLVSSIWMAVLLLAAIGAVAGLMVVPMNALLQHRGLLLMHPGQSIAVQNFNESLASLLLLGVYGLLVYGEVSLFHSIAGFGLFVVLAMLLIAARHHINKQRQWRRDRVPQAVGYLQP